MTTYDKSGNVLSGFSPPTVDGKMISYEEYCERSGAPFTEEQRAVRQAYYDFEKAHGGFMVLREDPALEAEWARLGKAIHDVDLARFDALRATGWDWPHRRKVSP